MNYILLLVVVLILICIVWGIRISNRFIMLRNNIKQSFGSVEIYLKKRFDLIPNLVAIVEKYTQHEKDVLIAVTKLRTEGSVEEQLKTSKELDSILNKLSVNVEQYPNLKADNQFTSLQIELSDMEDYISAARRNYNASVTTYNNMVEMFPTSIIASFRNEKVKDLLEIPKSNTENIDVNQLFNKLKETK